ncbi:MAG TPA: RsmG family class I SAM-dependent methyltransferase [Polyangiales bacterium]|nr:RsmG family class I SAM-dependent methyltransferase [Polyangiales bacterium]
MYNPGVTQGFQISRDRAQLERVAQAFGRTLTAQELAALGQFLELVTTWNAKLDLTAARETQQLVEVMLWDSFVLAGGDVIAAESRCVDVGSGAGAPALPFALLRADVKLTLVESLRKRVAFLRTAVGALGLVGRVVVVERKLDVAAPDVAGAPFDVAMSRATFAPELWLRVGMKLAPSVVVMLAGQDAPEGRVEKSVEYALPNGAPRRLVVYARH